MGDSTVAERVERVRTRIAEACLRCGRSPDGITLIGVTKGVGADAVRAVVAAGIRDLGENRVQEAAAKRPNLLEIANDVTWHMIGHLQTNKVKTAILLFDIIHSVDSLPLAEAISRRASYRRQIFLEVNVSAESSKFGFSLDDLSNQYQAIRTMENIEVRGLMTVAPQAKDAESVRPVFRRLRHAADSLGVSGLSMGMSDDFEVAVEEGATHLRIGRAIFGERPQ